MSFVHFYCGRHFFQGHPYTWRTTVHHDRLEYIHLVLRLEHFHLHPLNEHAYHTLVMLAQLIIPLAPFVLLPPREYCCNSIVDECDVERDSILSGAVKELGGELLTLSEGT